MQPPAPTPGLPAAPNAPCFPDEVVEIELLLTRQQADALERLSSRRGMSPARFLRELVTRCLTAAFPGERGDEPPSETEPP
jgi:hypothetical protein